MSKPFLIAFGIAAALLIGFALLWSKPGHIEATGKIVKVRAQKVDDNETVVIFDFNMRNDSGQPRTVHTIEGHIDAADGSVIDGHTLGSADLANVFRNFAELGNQFNPSLKAMDEIGANQSLDRTVGLRFDAPDDKIAGRKDIVLDVQYINGPLVELKAK